MRPTNETAFLRQNMTQASNARSLIRRTKPVGHFVGYGHPTFIRNMQYHLTTLDAYSDGAVDIWGFLDLDLFTEKLRTGWVWPSPPNGERISVHSLGQWTSCEGQWTETIDSMHRKVIEAVHELNPQEQNLLNMEGSDTEMKGKVRYAKLGLSDREPCRQANGDGLIIGREVPVFAVNGVKHVLTRLFIFSDGLCRIGYDGSLQQRDTVIEMFSSGRLVTSVPDGCRITVEGLGSSTCAKGYWYVDPDERVREIIALHDELNGANDPVRECLLRKRSYLDDPTKTNLEALRFAYLAVPEHLRLYCGDMDSKDSEIRKILREDEG